MSINTDSLKIINLSNQLLKTEKSSSSKAKNQTKQSQLELSLQIDPLSEINGIYKKNIFVNSQNETIFNIFIQKPYDPYQIPPDWNASRKHAQARRIGIEKRPALN